MQLLSRSSDSGAMPSAATVGQVIRSLRRQRHLTQVELGRRIGMLVKKQMYQHAGKRLIPVYPRDLPRLHELLTTKLALFGRPEAAFAAPTSPPPGSPAPYAASATWPAESANYQPPPITS